MYVVVNISPGADMSLLMETLATRTLTFSVTDDLSKLCAKCSRNSQPLPVPHQLPENSPQLPSILAPSTSLHPFHVKSPPVKKPRQKEPENKKKEDEISLFSESDPCGNEDTSTRKAVKCTFTAQLDQLASFSGQNQQFTDCLFKMPKEEPGTSESQMTSANAASIVSDLFKKMEEMTDNPTNTAIEESPIVRIPTSKDCFRGECRLCQMPISIRTHHMRRHAMKHLGFKTYICQLCQKDFNRSDLCKSHFERYHPNSCLIPFQDIITSEQQEKLDQMIQICFQRQ